MTARKQPTTRQSLEAISTTLDHVRDDVQEIKIDVKCLDQRQTDFEKIYVKEHQVVVDEAKMAITEARKAHQRIDQIDTTLQEFQKSMQPLVYTNKILSVIGGILAASVIALIWSLITNQVSLTFP